MDDLTTLAQIVAVLTVMVLPVVLVARFLDGRDPDPMSYLDQSTRMLWPRGVQEEDPRPWQFAPSLTPHRVLARLGRRRLRVRDPCAPPGISRVAADAGQATNWPVAPQSIR